MSGKNLFLETRPQFLILAVVLVAHGSALAAWQGGFDWGLALLAVAGLVLMQASVNVLNDWHDWSRTGIDRETPRTPFSGGSGLLPAGAISSQQALVLGIATLVAGSGIGLYLAWVAGWELLVIGLVGAASVVAYTPVFNRIGAGELMAGFTLGTLPVVGTYFLLTGSIDAVAWVSGIPAGLLTYNLLFLNEFPDADADRAGGRRHMVILLGRPAAARAYVAIEVAAYVAIVAGVASGVLTPWALLGLVSAVVAVRAITGALAHHSELEPLLPAMGANIAAVLGTNVLLAVGYTIAALV